ncbi:hypothetical protein K461DRAFT_272189 [Myriangium duriaei CBS 260.36]|uniref:Xylanolytic transcriptional activator regulatory domain-containing protein n=1 Tax=Myriangium duriaei CBS 260.36 TaxID=1168546 RepID=A0A9P4MHL5_9PEZI|nr:hypothetical protein K461DRAFT_272189 [Myriangium duriaei CBS 260.36]
MATREQPVEIGIFRRSNGGHTSFIGSSSGVHFINTVRRAFASTAAPSIAREDPDRGTSDSYLDREFDRSLLGHSEEQATDGGGTNDESESHSPSSSASDVGFEVRTLPEKATAKRLATWFFRSWHPFLPFLHGPTFMRMLDGMYETPRPRQIRSRQRFLTVLCVLKIASLDETELIMDVPTLGSTRRLLAVVAPMALDDDIESVQALLAAHLFLTVTMSLEAASSVGGLICRAVVKSGLHRCPYRFRNISLLERDMRKRIFWTAETTSSEAAGENDTNRRAPIVLTSPAESGSEYQATTDHAQQRGNQSEKEQVFTNVIKCARFTGQILEIFHKSIRTRTSTQDILLTLKAEIDSWWNQIPRDLESRTQSDSHSRLSPDLFFTISYNHLRILMNRPFLSLNPSLPLFCSSMQECLHAARNIIDTFSRQDRPEISLKWPSYMSCLWMAGLLVAFASQCRQYPVANASFHLGKCLATLDQMTKRWQAARHCFNVLAALKVQMEDESQTRHESPYESSINTYVRPPNTTSSTTNRNQGPAEFATPHTTTAEPLSSGGLSAHPSSHFSANITEARSGHLGGSTANFLPNPNSARSMFDQPDLDDSQGMLPPENFLDVSDIFQTTDWESLMGQMNQESFFGVPFQ